MKPLFALLVAAVVVIGTAPIGAAAVASPDASPAALGTGPGPAQTQDNETVTGTQTSNTTESDAAESNTTETATETETTSESDTNDSSGTADDVEPGAQLAGVVAIQRTEVESEVGSRAFGQRVAAAASNGSKAAIVASEVNDSQQRLIDLRERLDELEAAHEAGNISEGRYRANVAQVSAEINAIERRLEQSNDTAASLPADVREANGINTSNIEQLRTEARNLSGPEVAEIARSIGGNQSGRGLGDAAGPPGRSGEAAGPTGPPNDAGTGNGGPPENRTGNGPGGESASDRGSGNGSDSERGSENAPDRGSEQRGAGDGSGDGDAGGNPQESEANRNDRENGESDGSQSGGDDAGGPDSDRGNGENGGSESGGNDDGGPNTDRGNGPDDNPSNDGSEDGA